jgi:hypothetical protein
MAAVQAHCRQTGCNGNTFSAKTKFSTNKKGTLKNSIPFLLSYRGV